MSCTPKIKNTCGVIAFATCTYYEGTVPAYSGLFGNECYTVEEVIADLYQISTNIKAEIDLTILEGNGITYTLEEGEIIVKNALAKHAEDIKALQTSVANIITGFNGDIDITGWGLNTDCLVDACEDPITTMKQLLQALITTACNPPA